MRVAIPEPSLVLLVGASGSGKSTFARRHFKLTEVLSSDTCRGLVSDDENNQAATGDAFEVLHFIAAKRLAAGRLTVVDATNVQVEARRSLLALARQHYCLAVAIVFNLPERTCQERNQQRADRAFGAHVVRQQTQQLRRSLGGLRREGFHNVSVLSSPEEIDAIEIERQPLHVDLKGESGPFDVIGDVHGCFDELVLLLDRLGYEVTAGDGAAPVRHPAGRKVIFLGDLVDRGPGIAQVLRLAMDMVDAGVALCIPGNHEWKLLRKLRGRDVQVTHGLAESLAQLNAQPPAFAERVAAFLDGLVSHYVLDGGNLVVAHAGLKEAMQGRASARVRDFALYGETTGETDEFGLPIRYNWAADYRGHAMVVYGHTPVPVAEWLNRTINIDTGCVFGGKLTALRYPERELISVPAARVYYASARPFLPDAEGAPVPAARPADDLLDIDDVLGKRIVTTRLSGKVTIREEQASAALEVMSRFALDPRWLIYLPPTMSPSETSQSGNLLEHPAQALGYYRHEGVPRVVCEEKHMGSRAVVIVGRDEGVPERRFGIQEAVPGVCYTRTGRRFFDDLAVETAVLDRVRSAVDAAGLWEELQTDWLCLDCELMPWSAKAQQLVRQQYAPVGAAARAALRAANAALAQAAERGVDAGLLAARYRDREEMASAYVAAYGHYCWPVSSVSDLRLAPFHLLASEGKVYADRDHAWHMETLARLCRQGAPAHPEPVEGRGEWFDKLTTSGDDALLLATPYRVVDVTDPASEDAGIRWWEELTAGGGEGMVVKPFEFVARGRRGVVQPAIKCRGPEYLRIIYGPEYSAPENLDRLRQRAVGAKRSLALREFALGIEALERFVRREPLYRIHECVFGVLALESDPIDPRL